MAESGLWPRYQLNPVGIVNESEVKLIIPTGFFIACLVEIGLTTVGRQFPYRM